MPALPRESSPFAVLLLLAAAVACDDTTLVAERPPVASVLVTPSAREITVGESLTLRATPRDPAGEPLEDRPITWSSESPAVATVAGGVVVGVQAGTAVITATSQGREGRATITVRAAHTPVARVDLDAGSATLTVGATRQLTAVARDAAGGVLEGRAFAWTSSAPAVATVTAAGVVTAAAPGTATITVASEGREASVTIAVTTPPGTVTHVTLDRAAVDVGEGDAVTLVATPRDAQGQPVAGLPVAWSSADPRVATVSAEGRVEGMRPGATYVVATVAGRTAEASVTVSGLAALAHDLVYDLTRGIAGVGPEVFALDLRMAGAAPRRVLRSAGTWDAAPSPDGTKLAFTARGLFGPEIVVANRDGSNVRIVASGFGGQDQPAWSPDGTRIAFRRWAPGGPPGVFNPADIWVMNADGTAQRNLTDDGDAAASMEAPAWAPRRADGVDRIAYARRVRLGDYVGSSIHAMRADGTEKRALTTPGSQLDEEPAWAPDGATVAFVRTDGSEDHDLWLLDVATGEERPLFAARIPGAQRAPAWSPDGRLLAFTSSHEADERGAFHQVFTVWPDGSRLVRRTFDAFDKERPAWLRRAP